MPAKVKFLFKFYFFVLAMLIASALILIYTWTSIYHFRDEAVNVLKYRVKTNEKILVVIDPGHGGHDGGASSDDGIQEKDLNLAISKKLSKLLEIADIPYIMTRETDILLHDEGVSNRKRSDLNNRVKIARDYPEAYFVSIHMNKFPEGKYWGLQVYYSRNAPQSEELAVRLQYNVRTYLTPENQRLPKPGNGIFILDNIKSPAVIIECGFLSNQTETIKLCSDDYQNKLSFLIFESIVEQLEASQH